MRFTGRVRTCSSGPAGYLSDADQDNRPSGPPIPANIEVTSSHPKSGAAINFGPRHRRYGGPPPGCRRRAARRRPGDRAGPCPGRRARSGRIAACAGGRRHRRGAYQCGDWAQALSEFRAAKGRMAASRSSSADRRLRTRRRPARAGPDPNWHAAPRLPTSPATTPTRCGSWPPGRGSWTSASSSRRSLCSPARSRPAHVTGNRRAVVYAYAETLLARAETTTHCSWSIHAAAADIDGVTDAEDRVSELA